MPKRKGIYLTEEEAAVVAQALGDWVGATDPDHLDIVFGGDEQAAYWRAARKLGIVH